MFLSKSVVQLLCSDVVVVAVASIAGKTLSASCGRGMTKHNLDLLESF